MGDGGRKVACTERRDDDAVDAVLFCECDQSTVVVDTSADCGDPGAESRSRNGMALSGRLKNSAPPLEVPAGPRTDQMTVAFGDSNDNEVVSITPLLNGSQYSPAASSK